MRLPTTLTALVKVHPFELPLGWSGRNRKTKPFLLALARHRWLACAWLLPPLGWILLVNVAPLAEMVRISFLADYPLAAGEPVRWSLANYAAFVKTPVYFSAYLRTLVFAATTTVLSLLIVYPLAYYVALRVPPVRRVRRLLILLAPFWTSEIIRTFAIILLLANRGGINILLQWLGLTSAPVPLLYTAFSVAFGMLYAVLLSMLLPLYMALTALPPSLLEAATDLGAGPWTRFRRVTLPLTRGGIASGCALVFLLSTGAFAVPMLLGGADTTLFSMTVGDVFASAGNKWPLGAAFGMILLISALAICGILTRGIQPARRVP